MREIEFRGKRIDNGKWVYGYLFKIWEHCFILWGTTNDMPNMIEVIPETVGQFTGLIDKNGKKIYEGDVVKTTALLNDHHQRGATVVSPVEYWHGATCLSITYVPLSLDFQVSHEIEIIGNIHDNPELMKLK